MKLIKNWKIELDGGETQIEILSALRSQFNCFDEAEEPVYRALSDAIHALSAEPETSRIEQELHGKTPEEQYDFIYWLLLKFGLGYTDSRLAIIEWLRGKKNV